MQNAQETFWLARVEAVIQASQTQSEAVPHMEPLLADAAHNAPLYFNQTIPSWPPRFFVQKLVRRLLLPALGPQVAFNQAVRAVLSAQHTLWEKQQDAARDAQSRTDALERQVEQLREEIAALRGAASVESGDAANTAPPPWDAVLPGLTKAVTRPAPFPLASLFFGESVPVPDARPEQTAGLPRMALVSPFPPQESGVADYSEEIAAPLQSLYDLDLFTDAGYTPRLPASLRVQSLHQWERTVWTKRRNYRALVYQMGNNQAFHAQMYVMLRRWAGITVLHDYSLSHLLMGASVEQPDLGISYETELAHEVGPEKAGDLMRDIRAGKLRHEALTGMGIHLNRRIFTRSLGVVLHNQYSFDLAQNRTTDTPLITLIPPVMPPVKLNQTPSDINALREKWGVPPDAFVFAPCGIVTETKRPYAILDAFKILLAERPDAFLLFVGSVSLPSGVDFASEIQKRGLTERVKITGYVDVPTFNEYLLLSDVCVTLRFPSQGETSGALLRMLVHGKPSIVTAIGSFDDFPDDTVHKLPTPPQMKNEVGEIAEAFRLLANNKAYREQIAANGLAYLLREHSPQRCARLYARFVDEVMAHPATRGKLLADWAGRDIARRTQNGANGDALLAALRDALHDAADSAVPAAQ